MGNAAPANSIRRARPEERGRLRELTIVLGLDLQ